MGASWAILTMGHKCPWCPRAATTQGVAQTAQGGHALSLAVQLEVHFRGRLAYDEPNPELAFLSSVPIPTRHRKDQGSLITPWDSSLVM